METRVESTIALMERRKGKPYLPAERKEKVELETALEHERREKREREYKIALGKEKNEPRKGKAGRRGLDATS